MVTCRVEKKVMVHKRATTIFGAFPNPNLNPNLNPIPNLIPNPNPNPNDDEWK